MSLVVSIDSGAVEAVLGRLTGYERDKAMLSALVAGGKVLKDETVSELRKAFPGGGADAVSEKRKKPMSTGVTLTRDRDFNRVSVSIMKDFRLKWFELGTDERWVGGRKDRHGHYAGSRYSRNYRGYIGARGFFKKARSNSEGAVLSAIKEKLEKELGKLINN